MTSKQLALPERLPQRGSSAPLGAIGLKIQAEYLELTVEAVEGLARATADLSGPRTCSTGSSRRTKATCGR